MGKTFFFQTSWLNLCCWKHCGSSPSVIWLRSCYTLVFLSSRPTASLQNIPHGQHIVQRGVVPGWNNCLILWWTLYCFLSGGKQKTFIFPSWGLEGRLSPGCCDGMHRGRVTWIQLQVKPKPSGAPHTFGSSIFWALCFQSHTNKWVIGRTAAALWSNMKSSRCQMVHLLCPEQSSRFFRSHPVYAAGPSVYRIKASLYPSHEVFFERLTQTPLSSPNPFPQPQSRSLHENVKTKCAERQFMKTEKQKLRAQLFSFIYLFFCLAMKDNLSGPHVVR